MAAALLGVGGCSSEAPAPQTAAFEQVYTTRGIVKGLPDPSMPGNTLSIQHEAIPEFVNGAGEMSGMRSMTMPFPSLEPGVSLEGLEVGDKIRFSFGVTWRPSESPGSTRRIPSWTVTAIEELPADTELVFGERPAAVPAAAPEGVAGEGGGSGG